MNDSVPDRQCRRYLVLQRIRQLGRLLRRNQHCMLVWFFTQTRDLRIA
jgi:hypothetical protein